jgi:hypothetical protein
MVQGRRGSGSQSHRQKYRMRQIQRLRRALLQGPVRVNLRYCAFILAALAGKNDNICDGLVVVVMN